MYAATHRYDEALLLENIIATIDDKMISGIFSSGSERQTMAFLDIVREDLNIFLSLIVNYFQESPSALKEALNLVLRRKAIATEALADQRNAILSGKYPELQPKLTELQSLRIQIANKTLEGPHPNEGLEMHEHSLEELNTKKEHIEKELARHIPETKKEEKLQNANVETVAYAMDEQTTLIEFVRFNLFDFHAMSNKGESKWRPAHYLAFVLHAKNANKIQMTDLGEARHIDELIMKFRRFVCEDESDKMSIQTGYELYNMLFDPLLRSLGNCKNILIAPDGELTVLPFEVLPTDKDRRYLIDDYFISYISTSRDILRFGNITSGLWVDPLVAADPDFNFRDDSNQRG